MPGTTPKGYPYAQPADPLVQWPATSQALAEKIDNDRIIQRAGVVNITDTTGAGTPVVFNPPFPDGVTVVVIMTRSGFTPGAVLDARNVSKNGFSALAYQADGAVFHPTIAYWYATVATQ